MFTCLLVVCVGLAGDDWSYAKAESRPGVSKAATLSGSTRVPPTFTGRSVAKFVEHTPVVSPPAPRPLVAQTDGSWAPDKPTAAVQPTVKPEPPRIAAKDRCQRCGGQCACQGACVCDQREAVKPMPPKQWYVLPEDPTLEGYGHIEDRTGVPVLRYDRLRSRAILEPTPTTHYYPAPTRMPVQMPIACGRPGSRRG